MRSRVRRLVAGLRSERGVALPAAMMMLFIMGAVGVVVVAESNTSSGQSMRDRNVKRAIAAADAGIDTALYRLNKLQPLPIACVVVRIEAGVRRIEVEITSSAEEWCPEVDEDLGEGARYTYRVSKGESVQVNGIDMFERKIVATGYTGGATRRVKTVVRAMAGSSLLGDYAIISRTTLDLSNTPRVDGKVGATDTISADSGATLCGDAYSATGNFDDIDGNRCVGGNGNFQADPFALAAVDQKDAPTANNNSQFNSFFHGDANNRFVKMDFGDVVTLTGSVYSLCYLELSSNAEIRIAPRLPTQGPVEIFIDRPEDCPGADATVEPGNLKLLGSSRITNLNADPGTFVLYQVGSPNQPTTATFQNEYLLVEPVFGMVVYSPNSTVDLKGESSIRGAIGAKEVSLEQEATLQWDPLVGALAIDNLVPLYQRRSWVECRSVNGGPDPDSDCS